MPLIILLIIKKSPLLILFSTKFAEIRLFCRLLYRELKTRYGKLLALNRYEVEFYGKENKNCFNFMSRLKQ
jgi:hypothetical protein